MPARPTTPGATSSGVGNFSVIEETVPSRVASQPISCLIWFSILGVTPFTLALPYADLFWTTVLSVVIGFILASAFSAIVVYAQELVPGSVGMIAGIFFGLMFGFGGIGAALLGYVADLRGIEYVYGLCSFLPLFGLLAVFLPSTGKR